MEDEPSIPIDDLAARFRGDPIDLDNLRARFLEALEPRLRYARSTMSEADFLDMVRGIDEAMLTFIAGPLYRRIARLMGLDDPPAP